MDRIQVDDSVVRNHVTVMEESSDDLRRDEQALQLTAELGEREPYSPTDPGVRFENVLDEALETYEDSLAAMGDELLVMARKLTQLAGEVVAVDDDLAQQLRTIADGIDGGVGTRTDCPTPVGPSSGPLAGTRRPDLPPVERAERLGGGHSVTPIAPNEGMQA
ncbi:hypothetical protein C8046_07550 [Serinibacter arcticus]|uniref:Uncharacterized protein n=1 Tax=Serinibacter arcticus TaxID=1655435 RepID=A0A2U1ZU64_9MICO|nr:hypothetical protein [Serinibacter arcticus]PWD50525.1 hypothetical protein C8046_07550 [Serinibacter arcticus]